MVARTRSAASSTGACSSQYASRPQQLSRPRLGYLAVLGSGMFPATMEDAHTWGTIPYIDALAERVVAAWAACSRGTAGAGATARDSSRCRSSKYGSSSRVKKEYAMPDRPALSTELSQN